MDYDIVIAGAGPAGLCLARTLSGHGLRIAVVEQQKQEALEKPAFDGREIALTQHSARFMRQLGLWERIKALDPVALAPLKDAQVLNGPSTFSMVIGREHSKTSELGWFSSNHLIRQAAYDCVQDSVAQHRDITLMSGKKVIQTHSDDQGAQLELDDGARLRCRLLVAADSRFSTIRRAMGIAADMHDFGRTMMVFMVTHAVPHEHMAWEWFDYGQTLALLPMNDDPATGMPRSSVVLTLPGHAIERLMAMPDGEFGVEITRRFGGRLGTMALISTRHTYPLVGVYPHRLGASHFACVGDAAVGMLPVTAHGFNLGLSGVERLSSAVASAYHAGQDWGHESVLAAYSRSQHRHAWPLFQGTNAVVKLFTDARPAPKLLRQIVLQGAQHLPPLKAAIVAQLSGRSPWGILREQLPRPPFARQG